MISSLLLLLGEEEVALDLRAERGLLVADMVME